jgi:hypothetical protein
VKPRRLDAFPENRKTPRERGFRQRAEEDSNLHPVNPD